ncbi:MAG TPA: DUF4252 domain-containing protein [Chitinophagales bacterium]|nr:DUF4252 domain-containing protein [Chitinophagales bacterium]
MKKLITLVFCAAVGFNTAHAASLPEPEDESTKLNLWIPGVVMRIAADIVEDHMDAEGAATGALLRKFGSINICIREGEAYADRTDKKITRKLDRMERRDYEQLMSVRTDEETVNISIRSNKHDKIKRMVLLVDEKDETFVYLKMHCRLKVEDIPQLVQSMNFDDDDSDK